MSFVNPDYAQEHTADAIFDELGIAHLLSDEQMKHVQSALGMLDENTTSLEGFLANTSQQVPVYASDPPNPTDGQQWINSATNQLKIRKNGVTTVIV